MTSYFKAVRPDGTDFYSGTVQWIPPEGIPEGGWLVRHPTATVMGDYADSYLSVATVPTGCTGAEWPCGLLRVEPAGRAVRKAGKRLPNKRRSLVWRVTAEIDPHLTLGPQGREVAAIIERAGRLTDDEMEALSRCYNAAWDAAWDATWDAARYAARDAARDAAWGAAGDAARDAAWGAAGHAAWGAVGYAAMEAAEGAAIDAALATLTRDLITREQYDLLMRPWREVISDE